MKGVIYIAGGFCNPCRGKCGQDGVKHDNDPHFWDDPPTWGICRNDLRRKTEAGDYVFFVLPKRSHLPQMVFGYLKVAEKITHLEAYHRPDLREKRMGKKDPNGNIIVDQHGGYSRFDGGAHERIFDKVKQHYVIGCVSSSRLLPEAEIRSLAPAFLRVLKNVTGRSGQRPIDVISRKGLWLSEPQAHRLLAWL